MAINRIQPLVKGPWNLLGDDMQYYHDQTRSDVQTESVAGEFNIASMCIGPDGMPWVAHNEIENLTTGGAAVDTHGIFVHRWDTGSWVQVPYSGTTDGAVSPLDYDFFLSQGYVKGGVVSGSDTNGVAQSPHICCDGTYIYVFAYYHLGADYMHVYQWDGATWNVFPSTAHPVFGDVSLACSPNDVGHPFIYYQTSATLAYVDRWNGSSWDHVGGSNIPISAPEASIFSDNNFLRIDNAGNPHALSVRFFTSASVTVGQNIWMHSWTGSTWTAVPLNTTTLGVDSDYRSGGTEQTGVATTSPLVSSYGTNGKFQVAFSMRRYTKTAGHEMLDQPTGFGCYVVEYDCDAYAWIPLNGAAKYGHVYTYNADKATGIKAIPILNQNGPFGLAEPEVSPDVNQCWLAQGTTRFAGGSPIVMVFDGQWRTVSSWYPNLASQTYTDLFRIQLDPLTSLGGDGSTFIVRDERLLYLPVRWWNLQEGNYQRWNNELDDLSGTGTHDDDAEFPSLNPLVKNIFTIVLPYDVTVNPNVGGQFWQNGFLFTNNETQGIPTSFTARVKLEGSSGNGDIAIFKGAGAGVFQGSVRISTYGVWQELVIVTGITWTGFDQIGLRLGINGGATSLKIDWLEQYPTNESSTTRMHTYLYRGHIGNFSAAQIYRRIKI